MKRKIILTLLAVILLTCLALTLCACSLFGGKDGADGKSAYDIAVEHGFEGTEEQWLAALRGTNGQNGTNGKSAYDIAVEHGFEGTEQQWLDSLKAQSGEDTSGYTFESNGTGYTFTGIGDSNNPNVVIPSTYKGKPVTAIGREALCENTWITSVTIPEGVTSIGSDAFKGCSSLESITVQSGNPKYYSEGNCIIEKATNKLIVGCKTSVIPSGVTSIGYSAFYGCSSLTSVTIPEGVTSIGAWAFCDCSSLTSITIPESVTGIDDFAFSGCSSLTEINYGGTMAQWRAISKGYDWNSGTGNYTIHCSDGNI